MSVPNHFESVRVLLVEDNEDDYLLAKRLLSEANAHCGYQIDWCQDYTAGLALALRNEHDVVLVDYHLGDENGIDLLREAQERGCQLPMILLTGDEHPDIDLLAIKMGAADYLDKNQLQRGVLERSIRYVIERHRAATQAAIDQTRLAAFGADVGLALTQRESLPAIMQACVVAMVHYLNAAVARIWIVDAARGELRLLASSGVIATLESQSKCQPDLALDLEELAQGRPLLIKKLAGDARVVSPQWVEREGLLGCACYPLVLEERLVGVMSLFSRGSLTESILNEMASVARGIALCIERKRSEQALDASEIKYRSVVENVREVIFQLDNQGRWCFLNPAWTEITGYKVSETLGTHFSDYVHPDDRDTYLEMMQEVIERSKSSCRGEIRYRAHNGTFRWIEVCAQPLLDSERAGTSGTLSDITERKRAEAEIQKLAAFARLNPDPVMELASDGTLTYYNQAARELAKSLNVPEPASILPPEAAGLARECLRTGHSKLHREMTLNRRTLTWSFFPIIPSQVVHVYGGDITERLDLENQLRHSQKLDSIGQLAAGVAHDFNNILTIIQGHADRLLNQHDQAPDWADPLHQISAAARRASALTRQLLVFSRKQIMQPQVMVLNAVLGNLSTMLRRLLGEDIRLESILAPDLPPVECDAGMIEQVIMNLAVNSRDAMPRGGRLTITTAAATIDAAYVQQRPEARLGRFVCLTVSDTGCGMSPEILNRIFEPFFTTKEVGKGTGLGLATVYGIVKQHQGWAEVTSEKEAGTTFRIFIPVTEKKPSAALENSSSPSAVRGGRETILLVEDEPVLRQLARVILQDYDYRVLEASTGGEALKVWDQYQGRVDLLLTDMVMPEGMTGRELAEELKSRKPSLKVVFTSGYSPEIMGQDLALRDTMFLQKPYPPPQLAQTVRACLDLQNN